MAPPKPSPVGRSPTLTLPRREGVVMDVIKLSLFRKEGPAQRREFEHSIVGTRHAVSAKKNKPFSPFRPFGHY